MKRILAIALIILSLNSYAQTLQDNQYLLVGTYTNGSSKGIHVYRYNKDSSNYIQVSEINSSNPSFLALSPDKQTVYAVNEDAPGNISAYHFDKATGKLSLINQQPTNGNHPCYVSVSANGKYVFAGNYSSGNFSIFPVQKNTGLATASATIQHKGYSVNTERQTSAHVHSTVLSKDNKYLFVPDLGIDKVMIYSFNAQNGKITAAKPPFAAVEAGAGPRHFEFHPNGKFAYLMKELSASVSVYKYSKGTVSLIQNISAQPGNYTGPAGSADIHVSPDGKFLYASNRGESNTIAIFKINSTNGMLSLKGHQSTMGKKPRNFNFDPTGNFLLVANQDSDDIVIFKRDTETGLLTDTGKRIKVGNPVCIKWINAE